MSAPTPAPAPANRRPGQGSRRFNPLKMLQHKRRLQQMPASPPAATVAAAGTRSTVATAPVAIPVPAPPVFDYCRFIELDYVPMETGCMVSMRPTKGYVSTKSPSKGYESSKSPSRDFASSKSPSKSYASTRSPSKGYTSSRSPEHHNHSATIPSTPRTRRSAAPPSNRDPFGNASHSSSSNSGSCKGSDCSPTKGRHQKYTSCTDNHGIQPPPPEQYLTPLQQKEVCIRHLRARLKETVDRLQDRDTEIDELRGQLSRMQEDWIEEECHRVEAQLALKEARREIQQLKSTMDTVHNSLSEAGGLSGDVGVQKYFKDINAQNHKLENLLLKMELAQASIAKEAEGTPRCRVGVGGSAPASVSGESPGAAPKPPLGGRGACSCDVSPAHSLTRSSTYTKLSEQVLADRNGNGPEFPCLSGDGTHDSGFVCCGESSVPSRADLLLEAAFLSEETASLLNSYAQNMPHSLPSSLPRSYSHTLPHTLPHKLSHTMPHSSTYETLCTGDRLAPFRCTLGGVGSVSHPCLSHHHLYLHHLREMGIQTESCPVPATASYPSDLDTIAEQRTFRSQACSPTSTWMSDEGEDELDSITTTTSATTATIMTSVTEPIPVSKSPLVSPLLRSATTSCSMDVPLTEVKEGVGEEEKQESEGKEKDTSRAETPGEETTGVSSRGWAGTRCLRVNCKPQQENTAVGGGGKSQVEMEGDSTAGREGSLGSGGSLGEIREGIPCRDETQREAELGVVHPQAGRAEGDPSIPTLSPGVERPHTSQPRRSTLQEEEVGLATEHGQEEEQGATGGSVAPGSDPEPGSVQKSYWSRHFLVDLLAVAVPVVPTVAWLCRGPIRDGQPMYHIGSLLRGCCTVALHSLRRGGGLRHYPAGGGDLGEMPL